MERFGLNIRNQIKTLKEDKVDKIVEYKLGYHWSADELSEMITDVIVEEGWQPFGNPFAVQSEEGLMFCQAVVKYSK